MTAPIFAILPHDLRTVLRVVVRLGRGINVHPLQLERELGWTNSRITAALQLLYEVGMVSWMASTVVPTNRGLALVKQEGFDEETGPWIHLPERRRRRRSTASE